MVFHNQDNYIKDEIKKLEESLKYVDENHILHTGPLIRREEDYSEMTIDERKKILMKFFNFFNKINISYKTFIVKREKDESIEKVKQDISNEIEKFLDDFKIYFSDSKLIIYYDNGQKQVSEILKKKFKIFDFEIKNIKPENYRLFQVADLVTTFELINFKRVILNYNSKTEIDFFKTMRDFNKDFYKKIHKKCLNGKKS